MYLPLATQLADLFRRIVANDYEVEHINARALPRGADALRSVELVARGLDGWVKNSVDAPRLTKRLRLPTFQDDVYIHFWAAAINSTGGCERERQIVSRSRILQGLCDIVFGSIGRMTPHSLSLRHTVCIVLRFGSLNHGHVWRSSTLARFACCWHLRYYSRTKK